MHRLRVRITFVLIPIWLLLQLMVAPLHVAVAAVCTIASTADGRPYVAPTASGPGDGKKVGFDNTHGQTAGNADWVLDGAFSEMACALAGQGYTVEEIRAYPLTLTTLTAYNAVAVLEPNIPFTTGEMQALQDYVMGGGGLLLVGDHYQADRNFNTWDSTEIFNGFRRGRHGQTFATPSYNYNGLNVGTTYTFNVGTDWLGPAFGLRFRYNAIDLVDAVNTPIRAGSASDPDDPGILPPAQTFNLTTGVTTVATYAGATISIVDPTKAMGIIYPNKGALKRWANAQADDPVAVYTDAVGTPACGTADLGGRCEGAYVAVAKPGAGKVAAAGDSSLFEDASPKYKREDSGGTKSTHAGWTDRDHDTLGINLVNWLATPDAAVGIPAALQQAPTPEPYDIFTIGEPLAEPWSTGPAGYLWYDATTFAAGAYTGTNPAGGGGAEVWAWNPLPANAYPDNKLAVYLDGQGLTASGSYATKAYLYVTSSGTQVSSRYNRSTGTFGDALVAQSLTANTSGQLKRWEFWQLTPATANRGLSVRLKVADVTKVTSTVNQVATGSWGYLTIESSLGYSNGQHAALFFKAGALDTSVWIASGSNTTVTLPAGTYTLEVRDDSSTKVSNVTVNITQGSTASLAAIIAAGGGGGGGGGGGKLLISEVFYDTPGDDNVEEWIELYNGTSGAIQLSGYTMTDNAGTYTLPAYSLPAGGLAVVARNTAGFGALYGFTPDISGLSLALGNSGDRVSLKNPTGVEIDFVAYENNVTGWSVSASVGNSIYRANRSMDTDTASDWTAGAETPKQ